MASAGCVEGEIPEDLLHSGMTKRDMKKRDDFSLNPDVPGRYFAGHRKVHPSSS